MILYLVTAIVVYSWMALVTAINIASDYDDGTVKLWLVILLLSLFWPVGILIHLLARRLASMTRGSDLKFLRDQIADLEEHNRKVFSNWMEQKKLLLELISTLKRGAAFGVRENINTRISTVGTYDQCRRIIDNRPTWMMVPWNEHAVLIMKIEEHFKKNEDL